MAYTTHIDTRGGLHMAGVHTITCTDDDIDALPDTSLARILRDQYREGVIIAPSEIAAQYDRETETAACASS